MFAEEMIFLPECILKGIKYGVPLSTIKKIVKTYCFGILPLTIAQHFQAVG